VRWFVVGCVTAACIALATALTAEGRDQHTLTASQNVLPILIDKCAGCHQAGGIAPFPLTSSQDAVQYASAIGFVTRQRIMPPWPPGPDSPKFVGQTSRQLTGEELTTIATWVAQGAKLGKPVSLPPPKPPKPAGALTLEMPVSYTPHAVEGATDDYHCFVLQPNLRQNEFVTSVQIQPGAPSIVHHVILFRETGMAAAAALSRNRSSAGKGWSCFGGTGLPGEGDDLMNAPWLGAWVPGKTSTAMPAGTGVPLPRGSVIVMQVHYNLLHGAKPDRSKAVLGLRPATTHLTPLRTMLLPAPVELPCPRGTTGPQCNRAVELRAEIQKYGPDEAGTVAGLLFLCGRFSPGSAVPPADPTRITTSCDRRLTAPITLYGVAGHMHTRGRDIRLVLDPGTSQQRTLLHIPRWSFHWQDAYLLEKPLHLRAGDVLRVQCRFDNTIGAQPSINGVHLKPRYVLWGEGTTDEMCLGLAEYTAG
jgi:hypothetical protein